MMTALLNALRLGPSLPGLAANTGGGGVFMDDLGRPMALFADDLGVVNFVDDLNRRI